MLHCCTLLVTQKHLVSTTTGAAAATIPQVTAVLFAGPNVGDAAFSADFNSRINARNIAFTADIVPQLPCAGSMVDCTASTPAAAGDKLTGNFAAQGEQLTGNFTVRASLPYDRLGGRLTLTAEDMPHQKDAWTQLSVYTQVSDNKISQQPLGMLVAGAASTLKHCGP
jgi:hypothetical protein